MAMADISMGSERQDDTPPNVVLQPILNRSDQPSVSVGVEKSRPPKVPGVSIDGEAPDSPGAPYQGAAGNPRFSCPVDKDWQQIALGMNLSLASNYEQRKNTTQYSVSADLWSNSITSTVKQIDGSAVSLATTWHVDDNKVEFDTKLTDPSRSREESTVSLAPNPRNNHLTFSSLTKDSSSRDVAKDLSDVVVNETCTMGDHSVHFISNERTPTEKPRYLTWTNIFDGGRVENIIKGSAQPGEFQDPANRPLSRFAGNIQANKLGWMPGIAGSSFTTDK
jgi:hypothetical protein